MTAKPVAPLYTFRVHPLDGEEFYTVAVFRSKKDMLRYWRETLAGGGEDFEAICLHHTILEPRTKGPRWANRPHCGSVLFYQSSVSAAVVAHEMTHAALFFADCQGWDFGDMQGSAGEKVARVVETLVRQFWRKYQRRAGKMDKT